MTLLVGSIFHMTRKIVTEMTYNVSMGTLNPTIPFVACSLLTCVQVISLLGLSHRQTPLFSIVFCVSKQVCSPVSRIVLGHLDWNSPAEGNSQHHQHGILC